MKQKLHEEVNETGKIMQIPRPAVREGCVGGESSPSLFWIVIVASTYSHSCRIAPIHSSLDKTVKVYIYIYIYEKI